MADGGEVACDDRPALFLLPRTFLSKKDAAIAPGASEEQELEAIEHFFMSTILSSSAESTEEAKNISNGAGDPSKLHYEDGDRAGVANAKDQVQGRRPALGRKRAHFSFNPNVSDSHLNVDLKSSVDQIEDPDELFMAFENIECAKKELKKQMGDVAIDSSPNMQWAAARKRRPGILGRKASYKHHFPEHIDTAEAFIPSQGENQTFSPSSTTNDANSNTFSQQVSQFGTQPEVETNGSDLFDMSDREGFIADKEKGVDKLLHTLLHCFEDLDKGEEIDFLQERLQIKSTNVDKICLPSLDGLQINDVTMMDNKLAAEKLDGSLAIRVSPTIASSPLATISVLRRRISQIDPLNDPFSILSSNEKPTPENSFPHGGSKESALSSSICVEHLDMAGSEVKNASGSEHAAKARSKVSSEGKLQSTITEAGMTIPTNIALGDSEEFHSRTNGIADHCAGHASAFDNTNAAGSTSFDASSEDNASVDGILLGVTAKEADHGDEKLPSGTLDSGNVGASAGLFDSRGPGNSSLDNDINADSFEIDGIVEDKDNDVQEAPASGGPEQSSINATTDIPVDGHSGNSSILPELNIKENQMDLTTSINGPVELEAPRKRQNRQGTSARRHSLAGAGMAWQSGVRRSTRIKMKPLEYWRGERLLYARIHDSLPTLVGVKYTSPAAAGQKQKPVLKVKSYVSEEYAGLVQKIALH